MAPEFPISHPKRVRGTGDGARPTTDKPTTNNTTTKETFPRVNRLKLSEITVTLLSTTSPTWLSFFTIHGTSPHAAIIAGGFYYPHKASKRHLHCAHIVHGGLRRTGCEPLDLRAGAPPRYFSANDGPAWPHCHFIFSLPLPRCPVPSTVVPLDLAAFYPPFFTHLITQAFPSRSWSLCPQFAIYRQLPLPN